MPDSVSVHLEDIELREVLILDSSIDQQGGSEVVPLPEHPLMLRICGSSHLHGFIRIVEITHEISCSGLVIFATSLHIRLGIVHVVNKGVFR